MYVKIECGKIEYISLGYGRVLVGLGDGVGLVKLSKFEVVDLRSAFSDCSSIPDFPFPTEGAVGGLGPQDQPVICGGFTLTENCFVFRDGEWRPGIMFTKLRNSKLILKKF